MKKISFFAILLLSASSAFSEYTPSWESPIQQRPSLTAAGAERVISDFRETLRKENAVGCIVVRSSSGAVLASFNDYDSLPSAASQFEAAPFLASPVADPRAALAAMKAASANFFGVNSEDIPEKEFLAHNTAFPRARLTNLAGGVNLRSASGGFLGSIGVTAFTVKGRKDLSGKIASQVALAAAPYLNPSPKP